MVHCPIVFDRLATTRSVSIAVKTKTDTGRIRYDEIFNSANVRPRPRTESSIIVRNTVLHPVTGPIRPVKIEILPELRGTELLRDHSVLAASAPRLIQQIKLTHDKSDYLWSICENVLLPPSSLNPGMISIYFSNAPKEVTYVYLDNVYIGMLHGSHSRKLDVDFTPFILKGAKHSLSLLTVSMGLAHYSYRLENVVKGLQGSIYFTSKNLGTLCHWKFIPGLYYENIMTGKTSIGAEVAWKPLPTNAIVPPLSWLKLSLPLSSHRMTIHN